MMHYEDDRILEALKWLYGGEFDPPEPWGGDPDYMVFEGSRQSVYLNTKTDQWFVGNAGVRFGVTADIAHALEVTAPWEWEQTGTGVQFVRLSVGLFARVIERKTPSTKWEIMTDAEVTLVGFSPHVEDAQRAARAAYLRWMRGAKP